MLWSDLDDLWNNNAQIHIREIDTTSHRFFSVRLTMDLNGDQVPDLLVTNNDGSNGSLIAYELPPPGEILTGPFKKHILASGFKPVAPVQVGGAPGHFEVVKLPFPSNRKKPVILLSGDDDGSVYLLEAVKDDDPSDWQYTLTKLYDSGGSIVGQLSIQDVDMDGYPELFVPVYDRDRVLIYRLTEDSKNTGSFLLFNSFLGAFIIVLHFMKSIVFCQ